MKNIKTNREGEKPIRHCEWFPDIECDEICGHLGCRAGGLIIEMKAQGVSEKEIGGDPRHIPSWALGIHPSLNP